MVQRAPDQVSQIRDCRNPPIGTVFTLSTGTLNLWFESPGLCLMTTDLSRVPAIQESAVWKSSIKINDYQKASINEKLTNVSRSLVKILQKNI